MNKLGIISLCMFTSFLGELNLRWTTLEPSGFLGGVEIFLAVGFLTFTILDKKIKWLSGQ